MSEQELSSAAAPLEGGQFVAAPAVQTPSAGAVLRQLRESAGVDPGTLAAALKISLAKLQALEADRYDELPDLNFARGLAASICRAFGVDEAPVLALMPRASIELHPPKNALNTPLKRSGRSASAGWAKSVPRSLLVVVGLLLLGSAALWLWPTLPIRLDDSVVTAHPDAVQPVEEFVEDTEPATRPGSFDGTEPDPLTQPDPGPDEASQEAPPEQSATQATVLGPLLPAPDRSVSPDSLPPADRLPAVPGRPVVSAAADQDRTPAADAVDAALDEDAQQAEAPDGETEAQDASTDSVSGVLGLVAQAESWVSVQDAEGQSLLNRTLQAGDEVAVDGAMPLSVVIGRKDAVRVSVRGQDFDHLNLSRSSVARFQVE